MAGFFRLENSLGDRLARGEITSSEFLVFAFLGTRCRPPEMSFCGNATTIAAQLRMHPKTVQRALWKLRSLGLLQFATSHTAFSEFKLSNLGSNLSPAPESDLNIQDIEKAPTPTPTPTPTTTPTIESQGYLDARAHTVPRRRKTEDSRPRGRARAALILDQQRPEIQETVEYYRQKFPEHPRANPTGCFEWIERDLAEGRTVEDFKQAIDGLRASPHHNGRNEDKAVYTDLGQIFRAQRGRVDFFKAKAPRRLKIQRPAEKFCFCTDRIQPILASATGRPYCFDCKGWLRLEDTTHDRHRDIEHAAKNSAA